MVQATLITELGISRKDVGRSLAILKCVKLKEPKSPGAPASGLLQDEELGYLFYVEAIRDDLLSKVTLGNERSRKSLEHIVLDGVVEQPGEELGSRFSAPVGFQLLLEVLAICVRQHVQLAQSLQGRQHGYIIEKFVTHMLIIMINQRKSRSY